MIERVKYIVNIVIVVLLFAAIAIQKDGKIAGNDVVEVVNCSSDEVEQIQLAETILDDGTLVINSTTLAKDVIGYAGHTPVKLYVKDNKIEKVEYEPNDETPGFFRRLVRAKLADRWIGMTLEEAATTDFDAISGVTMSFDAVVANVQRAAQYGANVSVKKDNFLSNLEIKDILGLLVIIFGVIITVIRVKSKLILTVQMVLNVVVLGFWCGSFLSLTTFTAWASTGFNLSASIVTIALLAVVAIMPLFNRKGSYCHIHCPMGSLQDLVHKVPNKKLKIKPEVAKFLNKLRYYILLALLFMMWIGVGFEIMNYEVFSAFIYESASTVVLVMAAIFVLLSLFITRPYCRFICPTGALITITQTTKK